MSSLSFRYNVQSPTTTVSTYRAHVYLRANAEQEVYIAAADGVSPAAAVEKAESNARLALEGVLGLWGSK